MTLQLQSDLDLRLIQNEIKVYNQIRERAKEKESIVILQCDRSQKSVSDEKVRERELTIVKMRERHELNKKRE